ncbi:hybrid sensor histidine kinase/response regulator [Pseudoalteromonas sp. T1lg75]|uniref:hybrid sensor histidine kinase/response regulator n=1 Tax=Pseudoalteromonas sp. T1lg75 TaxID=2077102 RepID=UPI000CF698BF|nr:hybrid sensor histidine kinase/response regulator [Pseudoalteromonas sp. T1lg75]
MDKTADHGKSLPEYQQQVNTRRLDMLLKQTVQTGFFSTLFTIVVTLMMHNTSHFQQMIYWVALNLSVVLVREIFIFPVLKRNRATGKISDKAIHRSVIVFWLFAGAIWGWAGYFYLPEQNQTELMVSFIAVFIGITAGNLIAFAPSIWAGIAFSLPALFGLAAGVYRYDYFVLFANVAIYQIFLLITMARISKSVINTITLDLKNQQLLQQVTQEKQRAETQKIKAQKANQSKTEFMTSASHDLRQPLNSLGLFLYGLKQKIQSGAGDTLPLVEKIEQAHKSLSSMFARMLEVSNVETGKITPQPSHLESSALIGAVVDEYRQQCQTKQVQLHYQPIHARLYTDDLLFSRIVRNLLDNAVKYTQHGDIHVIETLTNEHYRLDIQDTGIGIPKHELNHIFDEYHQVGNKRRDAKNGLGLGLFITFRLCQLLGITLNVTSTEGTGSCFSLTCNTQKIQQSNIQKSDIEGFPALAHLHILVVDDDTEILSGMQLILEQWQCRVDTASDIKSALTLAEQSRPDILLSDYRLEDNYTGLDLLHQLEEMLNQEVTTIFISGEHLSNSVFTEELADYLVLQKPIEPADLHQAIKDSLTRDCVSSGQRLIE